MSTAYPTNEHDPGATQQFQYAKYQPAEPAQPQKRKKGGCLKWGGIGLGALLLLSMASQCGSSETESGLARVTSISSPASEAAGNGDASTAPTVAPETAAPAAAAPAESGAPKPAPSTADTSVPREYKNALRSAESYLRMSGFSYQGLYEQLTSEYGEGYPPEAAQYALDNVKVDWNEQALTSAQSYQKLMPMSDSELFEQLTSEYGEQFTAEQAQYAIDHLDG